MRPRYRLGPIVIVLLALLLAPFGQAIGAPGGTVAAASFIVAGTAAEPPAGLPLCRARDASAPSTPPAHHTACRHCPACLLRTGSAGLLAAGPTPPPPPRRGWDVAAERPDPRPPLIPARPPSGFARAPPNG
ncbi:MAG: hypothetical protein BGO51_21555 [Rhodospirillales bacterium 69-11]|nr:MAG: hypothetical protein BGO51_21555 [Rhodospirillales bacterium 69-11]